MKRAAVASMPRRARAVAAALRGDRSALPTQRGSSRRSSGLAQSRSTRVSSAPASVGIQHTNRQARVFTEPFDSLTLQVITDNAGTPLLNNFGVIDLVVATGAGGQAIVPGIFGPNVSNLARTFSKWRLKTLHINYEPFVSSSTSGALAFGYQGDPFTDFSNTFSNVGALIGAKSTSVWQPMSMSPRVPQRQLYTLINSDPAASISAANQRDWAAGALCVAGRGLGNNLTYGTLRLSGVIEFSDPQGQTTSGSSDLLATGPDYRALMFGNTATAAAPFGSPAVSGANATITGTLPPYVSFNATQIAFSAATIPGVYTLKIWWTQTSGVITAAANYTAVSNVGAINTPSFSAAPPYSSIISFGTLAGPGFISFTGPTGMTSGNVNLELTRLPDDLATTTLLTHAVAAAPAPSSDDEEDLSASVHVPRAVFARMMLSQP